AGEPGQRGRPDAVPGRPPPPPGRARPARRACARIREREGARVPDTARRAGARGESRRMSTARSTAIGAFVLGALALIVAAILFFGGGAFLATPLPAVSFFHGSVAGLQVGAAVTYRGVEVGQVKSIGIRVDPETFRSIVQVGMALTPGTVRIYGAELPEDRTLIPKLVERGLAAQLVKQNFVTGLLTVDLDFRKDADR